MFSSNREMTGPAIRVLLIASLVFASMGEVLLARETSAVPQVPQTPAPQSGDKVILKEGTEVSLQLAQKLTSKSAVVGEPVEFTLAEDLKVGDALVVKHGARVLGTVTEGKESEKKKTPAKQLAIRLDYLRAGAAKIPLRGEQNVKGKRNKEAVVAGTIFLGLSGLLLTSGKKYELPEGTPVKAYVAEDTEVMVLQAQGS